MTGEKQSSYEFYEMMRNRIKQKSVLPQMMTLNDAKFFGEIRYSPLLRQLQSCFGNSSIQFSRDPMERGYQFTEIYNAPKAYTTDEHVSLWYDSRNFVTEKQVSHVLGRMKPRKHPGPMGITVEFLQCHRIIIAPALTHVFNAILKKVDSWRRIITEMICVLFIRSSFFCLKIANLFLL